MIYTDRIRFEEACNRIIGSPKATNGIGTLNEKTLHAVLKEYFEPYEQNRELKVGEYVADIVGSEGIIEIQTANLGRLRGKLEELLKACRVTVVYPLAEVKYLRWLDTETGEMSERRKSPKKQGVYDGIAELYKIKSLLKNPNLHICFCILEIDEIRFLNGWSENKKKGSTRCDRLPVSLREEIHIDSLRDYEALIPPSLGKEFTSADFARECKIKPKTASTVLNVLTFTQTVVRQGKIGRSILYQRGF